jgi:hypothetical protein
LGTLARDVAVMRIRPYKEIVSTILETATLIHFGSYNAHQITGTTANYQTPHRYR